VAREAPSQLWGVGFPDKKKFAKCELEREINQFLRDPFTVPYILSPTKSKTYDTSHLFLSSR